MGRDIRDSLRRVLNEFHMEVERLPVHPPRAFNSMTWSMRKELTGLDTSPEGDFVWVGER